MRISAFIQNRNLFARGPSPLGRGCREAAGEGENGPSSGPSGHLLPEGEGLARQLAALLEQLWQQKPQPKGLTTVQVFRTISIYVISHEDTLLWGNRQDRIYRKNRPQNF